MPEGGIWGLADACQTYLGVAVPKTHQTSDWAAPELSPGQLAYAAADAVLCWRLWARVGPQLKATNRDTAYRLQRDSLPVAAAMELRGIGIDRDAHAKLCNSWRASRESAAGAEDRSQLGGSSLTFGNEGVGASWKIWHNCDFNHTTRVHAQPNPSSPMTHAGQPTPSGMLFRIPTGPRTEIPSEHRRRPVRPLPTCLLIV